MNEMERRDNELLELLKQHSHAITTVRNWDLYASENYLPKSITLIKRFGSWNKLKDLLLLPNKRQRERFTREELIEIGKQHKAEFSTKRGWESFAKKNHLPSPQTYINEFKTWNCTREAIGLPAASKVRKKIYTKEDIIEKLEANIEHFTSRNKWDDFARNNNVPSYSTISKHLTAEEINHYKKRKRPKQ